MHVVYTHARSESRFSRFLPLPQHQLLMLVHAPTVMVMVMARGDAWVVMVVLLTLTGMGDPHVRSKVTSRRACRRWGELRYVGAPYSALRAGRP